MPPYTKKRLYRTSSTEIIILVTEKITNKTSLCGYRLNFSKVLLTKNKINILTILQYVVKLILMT